MAVYRYNKDVKYIPSGENLQVITGRDLYVQVVTVSEKGSEVSNFTVVLPKVFLKYVMEENDKRLGVWQNTPFKLWQTQLNFAVWCATSACGVGVQSILIIIMLWLRVFIDFTHITIFEELLKDCKHRYPFNPVSINTTTHTTRRLF